LTSSVLDILSDRKIPAVMTLHDYKLACPSYKFMFKDHICEDCKGARYYKAIKNRCHKESYWASAAIAIESYINDWFKKYRNKIKYFISPSHFLKQKLIDFGWPEKQIKTVPNFLNLSEYKPNYAPGKYFLYLGRLSEEKGIRTLIKAFSELQHRHLKLLVVGDGPIRNKLEDLAKNDQRICFAGYLSGNSLLDVIRHSLAVVAPSEWYENAPISILEALACGKPVIGAAIGGIPEVIDDAGNGFLFESGNRDALWVALERLAEMDRAEIENMGRAARNTVEREHGTESHYRSLMEIYQKARKEKGIKCTLSMLQLKACPSAEALKKSQKRSGHGWSGRVTR
jgi:glycosyltransferase involved in cell wall biosynthesis